MLMSGWNTLHILEDQIHSSDLSWLEEKIASRRQLIYNDGFTINEKRIANDVDEIEDRGWYIFSTNAHRITR
jgi:hypothetical protein